MDKNDPEPSGFLSYLKLLLKKEHWVQLKEEVFSQKNFAKSISALALLLIIAIIPLTVYVAQNTQDPRQRAANSDKNQCKDGCKEAERSCRESCDNQSDKKACRKVCSDEKKACEKSCKEGGAPTATPSGTLTPTITPSPTPGKDDVLLTFTLTLPGIGIPTTQTPVVPPPATQAAQFSSASDSALATPSATPTQRPLPTPVIPPAKSVVVELFNSTNPNQPVAEKTISLPFKTATTSAGVLIGAVYQGTVNMGTTIPEGIYTVKVKTDKYLRKQIPGAVEIDAKGKKKKKEKVKEPKTFLPRLFGYVYADATNEDDSDKDKKKDKENEFVFPDVALTVGDTNDDNKLDILDFNAISSCYGDKINTPLCTDADAGDFNEDSVVDGTDYNLFIRSLATQEGD